MAGDILFLDCFQPIPGPHFVSASRALLYCEAVFYDIVGRFRQSRNGRSTMVPCSIAQYRSTGALESKAFTITKTSSCFKQMKT